jgi:hypothetical protein
VGSRPLPVYDNDDIDEHDPPLTRPGPGLMRHALKEEDCDANMDTA